MRSQSEYECALWLSEAGLNDCDVSRTLRVPRGTVRDWRSAAASGTRSGRRRITSLGMRLNDRARCPICTGSSLDGWWYAYLLGMYLGDGCLTRVRGKNLMRLRISLDRRYSAIVEECVDSILAVRPGGGYVGRINAPGCVEVNANWKHWACLFPQHAPGRKHLRRIELVGWQEDAIQRHPERLVRGLIHSDGCRALSRVNGKDYARHFFSNKSADIRGIFGWACDLVGVDWRPSRPDVISVARRRSVARLDLVVGPKIAPAPVRHPSGLVVPKEARLFAIN